MSERPEDLWMESEGDNWFARNREALSSSHDKTLFLLELYGIKPRRVLEVGCANGYRLAALHEKYRCQVAGVEPSAAAIQDGQARWPFITFVRGTGDLFQLHQMFDVIIINFVFHWVPRTRLLKSVAQIDARLEDGGYLVIGDFGTKNYLKRKYHRRPQDNLFTYKQQYQNIYLATGQYLEIAKIRYNYDTKAFSGELDYENIATVSLLRKTELHLEH